MGHTYTNDPDLSNPTPRRLRAIVEIVGGEVFIFPVADSDVDRETILDALRIYFGETGGQSGQ
jgi:hypothetical protein